MAEGVIKKFTDKIKKEKEYEHKSENQIIEELKDNDKLLIKLYHQFSEEIRILGEKAYKNNFTTIKTDLIFLGMNLGYIIDAFPDGHKAIKHLNDYHSKINEFVKQYVKLGTLDGMKNNQEKIKAYIRSMLNALKNDLFQDFNDEHRRIENEINKLKELFKQ